MRPVVKGLLIGCGALLFVAVLAVLVSVRWFRANRERFREEGRVLRAEAREFGRGATVAACVARGLERYRADVRVFRETRARLWVSACLETAAREPAFCAEVPPAGEVLRTVNWRMDECTARGFGGDEGCTRILAVVQEYCGKR